LIPSLSYKRPAYATGLSIDSMSGMTMSYIGSSTPTAAALRAPTLQTNSSIRHNPRIYEVWHQVGGRNQFLCRGRCITGPKIDFWYNCCAWSFIVVPTIFYFVFCSEYLWHHVNRLLPVLTACIFTATVVFMLLTSCTDPGIIPRHTLQAVVNGLEQEVAEATGTPPLDMDAITAEPVCVLTQQQDEMGFRWCPSCKVVRPPRASHCRDCDNCVMRFDHHCPFVNNCVGSRNYAFFSGFLISTGCLGFAVFSGIGLYISHEVSGTEEEVPEAVLFALLAVIGIPTALLLIGVLGLSLFHVFLACRGRTTREALTGKVSVAGRTLFRMRGASLVHPRMRVNYPMTII